MIKSLIKEIFIVLLLTVAIVLILSILFYEYRPSTQKIPAAVQAYDLPEEMQEELDETIKATQTQNIVKIYKVDSDDLADYERTNDYNAGKINPFAVMSTETGDNNTVDGNTQNENLSNSTDTQGNFFNTVK